MSKFLFFTIVFIFGMYVQHSIDIADRSCTVTIKDHQGAKHVITGLADNE